VLTAICCGMEISDSRVSCSSLVSEMVSRNHVPTGLQRQFFGSEVSLKRGFSTHSLPENYDIFRGANSAPIRPASENEGSNPRSSSGSMSA
jgi:hypothetical protein